MRLLAFLLTFVAGLCRPVSAEPYFKPNDVIALLGGEDMVAANELGYLEALLQKTHPDHHLKIRCLAWEGDTVFEQRRDLNYPPLEAQLDKMGATVVIMQFGQAESRAGKEKVEDFRKAYERLAKRVSANGKRRVSILGPTPFGEKTSLPGTKESNEILELYAAQASQVPSPDRGGQFINLFNFLNMLGNPPPRIIPETRDGIHLAENDQIVVSRRVTEELAHPDEDLDENDDLLHLGRKSDLRKLVQEKNKLWFHYTRPQNWAFLAGDRTNQPSSRDHLDKNKRWFPEEMEQFVPLIDAKEKEIWALAAKLKGATK